jgi:signal transduction histidine kinase
MATRTLWIVYTVCSGVVILALLGLSVVAMNLDRQRQRAQLRERQDQLTRLALWRLDSNLAAILVQEAAQPPSSKPEIGGNELGTHFVESRFRARAAGAASPFAAGEDSDNVLPPDALPAFVERLPELPALATSEVTAVQSPFSLLEVIIDPAPLDPKRIESTFATSFVGSSSLSKTEGGESEATEFGGAWGGSDPPMSDMRSFAPSGPFGGQTIEQGAADSPMGRPGRPQEKIKPPTSRNPQLAGSAARQKAVAAQEMAREFEERALQTSNILANAVLGVPRRPAELRLGLPRPVWVGPQLVLARRIDNGNGEEVAGSVLDWEAIRSHLLLGIADTLPNARLHPAPDADPGDVPLLASAPIRLEPGAVDLATGDTSFLHLLLAACWVAVLLAIGSFAILLQQVAALSERRRRFVSSVTHELRSPLTTFSLYTEMLLGDMVQGEDKRRDYLGTLAAEARRLNHLVENVLAYSRIERRGTGSRRRSITVAELLELAGSRLADRARQAGMALELRNDDPERLVDVDPAAVEQILFNLVDNACKYADTATDRRIHVECFRKRRRLYVRVRDHGPGVSPVRRRTLFRPFSTSAREAAERRLPGVGLGLDLSRRLAREMGGDLWHEKRHRGGAAFLLAMRTC